MIKSKGQLQFEWSSREGKCKREEREKKKERDRKERGRKEFRKVVNIRVIE